MPKSVICNVEDYKLIDNQHVNEDVTSVTLPTIEMETTTVNAAGMLMAVDVPNPASLAAAEYSISHNNGTNTRYLQRPGRHSCEFRIAEQKYTVSKAEMGHRGAKVKMVGLFKSVEKGNVEKGNPRGSTVKFSLLRYEEFIDGDRVLLIDAMQNVYEVNGVRYSDEVQNLLR